MYDAGHSRGLNKVHECGAEEGSRCDGNQQNAAFRGFRLGSAYMQGP
jgi:hypothetical protein